MDKFAKMAPASSQGEPYENIVETNYGYDVAHDLAPIEPRDMEPRKEQKQDYYQEYDNNYQQPSKYVEEPDPNPYIDPR